MAHHAAEPRRACEYASCCCPEQCGFSGSRQMLLDHISAEHSRSIILVPYGQTCNLSLPLSQRWHILVGEEDEAVASAGADQHPNLFLVSLGEEGITTAVSLVCIREDGTAPGAPQFASKLAVEHFVRGTRLIQKSSPVSSSSLSDLDTK